jgi:hypothetical protein
MRLGPGTERGQSAFQVYAWSAGSQPNVIAYVARQLSASDRLKLAHFIPKLGMKVRLFLAITTAQMTSTAFIHSDHRVDTFRNTIERGMVSAHFFNLSTSIRVAPRMRFPETDNDQR